MDQVSHEPEKTNSSTPQLLITIAFGFIMLFLGLGFGYILFANRIPIQPAIYNIAPDTQSDGSKTQPTIYEAYEVPTSVTPIKLPVHPIKQPYALISTDKTSPTGEYIVVQTNNIDQPRLTLVDNKINVLVEDLLASNDREIGYGEKFACQCGISFKGWHSDTQFVILVANALGEGYEFLASAPSGKVDESSFRRIPDLN